MRSKVLKEADGTISVTVHNDDFAYHTDDEISAFLISEVRKVSTNGDLDTMITEAIQESKE